MAPLMPGSDSPFSDSRVAVPFDAPGAAYRALKREIDGALKRVMERGQFVLGPEVDAFEEDFSTFCGARFAVALSRGDGTLQHLLTEAGLQAGDEVLVAGNASASVIDAIRQTGARPVLVEPLVDTATISPDATAAAIGPRTAAMVASHWHGQPADLEALRALSVRYGLFLAEDATTAAGASFGPHRVGSSGHAAAFSFGAGMGLSTLGDAGAITTDDPSLAERMRRRRTGMEDLQATVLRITLHALSAWNARRTQIAGRYRSAFEGLHEIGQLSPPPEARPTWHAYPVRVADRHGLAASLRASGVETRILSLPDPPHAATCDYLAKRTLLLPIHPSMTDPQVDRVIDSMLSAFGTVAV